MLQIEIYEEFAKWLDSLFENNDIPENAVAFNFNLYDEEEENIYGVQIIASERFDENDSDWACDEIWSSEEDVFCVDISDEKHTDWKQALECITELVREYLETGRYKNILTDSKAVGIGFVDGELDILFKNL